MFADTCRYGNFGDVLMRIQIKGFRCHRDTVIEIGSPITGFCGFNGTGKSTILQLAAAAYTSTESTKRPYYINNFLVVGTLDPTPFSDDAAIEYRFWQSDRSLKQLKLSRNAATKRWQGYARRPSRTVFFVGNGAYLPKIEEWDFLTRNAHLLTVSSQSPVSEMIKSWTCKVLSQGYDSIQSNTVICSERTGTIMSVHRGSISYSESHMGYGEGRSQHLIRALELLPEKSLILIEEPETSLHASAQYELGQYLVDVTRRRKHQILLTTHSEFILDALPSQSRVYLSRTATGIVAIPGMTSSQAKSLMSQGHVKALHVLVEDECAKAVLTEIIRRSDQDFLRCIAIYPTGDADTVAKTVRAIKETGLPVAAVRDADQSATPSDNLFRLPGSMPPEKELWGNSAVKEQLQQTYGLNIIDFTAGLAGVNHHCWFSRLADHVNQQEPAILSEAARAYATSLPEGEVSTLTLLLKEAARR